MFKCNVIKKEIYQGAWENGEKHGKGTFYFENSIQLDGIIDFKFNIIAFLETFENIWADN